MRSLFLATIVASLLSVPSLASPTPPPTPITAGTVSGRVTDASGSGLAAVTIVLEGDQTGTQIIQTNASGDYAIKYYANNNRITLTPYKSGYLFSPASVGFISSRSLSGDFSESFTGTQFPIIIFAIPVLLTEDNSLRALALDSVTRMRDPFPVITSNNFSSDHHSRITLLAFNADLRQGENASSVVTAQATDSLNQTSSLPVEFVGKVPGFDWLSQVVLKLPDGISNAVEVWVTINVRGSVSNKVLIKVKP